MKMMLTIESDGQECQYDRGRVVGKIILYHGSPNETVMPKFGLGEEKHDYGKGFYLTESLELAKEWAVYRPNASNSWVHEFELTNGHNPSQHFIQCKKVF